MSTAFSPDQAKEFVERWVEAAKHLLAAEAIAPPMYRYNIGYAIQHIARSEDEARRNAQSWVDDHNFADREFYAALNKAHGCSGNIFIDAANAVPLLRGGALFIIAIFRNDFTPDRQFRIKVPYRVVASARYHLPLNRQPSEDWNPDDVMLVVASMQ